MFVSFVSSRLEGNAVLCHAGYAGDAQRNASGVDVKIVGSE
jgi:hypothetical protein